MPDAVPSPISPELDLPPELANHPKFRILGVLGRGGMGTVYAAQHLFMERQVALKVISPAVLEKPLLEAIGAAEAHRPQ